MNVKSRRPGTPATRQRKRHRLLPMPIERRGKWLMVRVVGVEPYLITIKSRVPDR